MGLVRVELTGNLDSYTTRNNVNSCHWIALDFLFPQTRIQVPGLVLVSMWMCLYASRVSTPMKLYHQGIFKDFYQRIVVSFITLVYAQ